MFDGEVIGVQRTPRKSVQGRTRLRRLRIDDQVFQLVNAIARFYRIPLQVLLNDSRGMGATYARQVAMYLAHVELGRPQKTVGLLFGRGPSTVSHACVRIEMLRDDPAVESEIARIDALVRTEVRHAH